MSKEDKLVLENLEKQVQNMDLLIQVVIDKLKTRALI